MEFINHPDSYKEGTRVLLLKSRPKDGVKKRKGLVKVSYSPKEFDDCVDYLLNHHIEGDRLYSSAGERCVDKAIQIFKQQQLDFENSNKHFFYKNLENKWSSSLQNTLSQKRKLWMFDCDNKEEEDTVLIELQAYYNKEYMYSYNTKSGKHFITEPFRSDVLSDVTIKTLHKNPLMLWGY